MINELKKEFLRYSNPEVAKQQSAYLKDQFSFYGLKSPERRSIQKSFLIKKNLPGKSEAFEIIAELWEMPERELHYFAMELLLKYHKEYSKEDIGFFEKLIISNSWWDSIDVIAPKILGSFFLKFPELRESAVDRWIKSGNIWLQRSAVLFQLKYKEKMDKELLTSIIDRLKNEKEFFIRKAIGWVLREASKRDPDWVLEFVDSYDLQPLSKKEALKIIKTS
tara:strand:- start:7261 stop:7926 length:666 start_codon:yes stop_codon:yes gene_type:complete